MVTAGPPGPAKRLTPRSTEAREHARRRRLGGARPASERPSEQEVAGTKRVSRTPTSCAQPEAAADRRGTSSRRTATRSYKEVIFRMRA